MEKDKIPASVRKYMAAIGRLGGRAKVKKGAFFLTREQRAANGKKGALARFKKKQKILDGLNGLS